MTDEEFVTSKGFKLQIEGWREKLFTRKCDISKNNNRQFKIYFSVPIKEEFIHKINFALTNEYDADERHFLIFQNRDRIPIEKFYEESMNEAREVLTNIGYIVCQMDMGVA